MAFVAKVRAQRGGFGRQQKDFTIVLRVIPLFQEIMNLFLCRTGWDFHMLRTQRLQESGDLSHVMVPIDKDQRLALRIL